MLERFWNFIIYDIVIHRENFVNPVESHCNLCYIFSIVDITLDYFV
jgi:hypothetical protein